MRCEISSNNVAFLSMVLLKKRCKILPAGGLGVSPSFNKAPKDWGIRGLIETTSVLSP